MFHILINSLPSAHDCRCICCNKSMCVREYSNRAGTGEGQGRDEGKMGSNNEQALKH